MSLANIANCGGGLNADLTPEELGVGFWSSSQNVRFSNGYATRFRGTAQVFDTPVVTPYFLTPYTTATTRFWAHAGIAAAYVDDGTTQTNITRLATTAIVSITRVGTTATLTSTAHGLSNGNTVTVYGATPDVYNGTFVIGGVATDSFTYTIASDPGSSATVVGVLLKPGAAVAPFTGAVDDRWTGGVLNGVFVLNNGVDIPQYWGGDTGVKLRNFPGWTTTWKATSIRPFKNFLIAVNMTKGSSNYPYMVKWSDIAVPGAIPTSWDETNPALDAGELDIDASGPLVDSLPLGDVLVVYAERSMHALTYIGAPYIFRAQKLPGDVGMLARGCAVSTPLGHVVLTAGDVVIHAGQGTTSIANAVIRDYIFKNINSTYYKRAFVTANPQKNEVWVCFPYSDSTTCNTACVWNWIDKTWSIRTLENVTYGDFGQFSITAVGTWASDVDTWNSDATTWNENEYSPAEDRLLMCHSTPLISLTDTGTADFDAVIGASMTRTGMSLSDPQKVKTIRSIYPRIDGNQGAQITIQVGAAMVADATPVWQTPQTFTIGTDQKIDSFATGRFLSLRLSNADYSPWRLRSLDIDYIERGYY